jgi:hypothetical protein
MKAPMTLSGQTVTAPSAMKMMPNAVVAGA